MRIGTNMSAIISNGYLSKSEKSLQKSLERLSSGYKINSAKDDGAGKATVSYTHLTLPTTPYV